MTIVERLGAFSANTSYSDLSSEAAEETKRLILDSIGCALAAQDDTKGQIGISIADQIGGGAKDAVIYGAARRSSVMGAAFANSELINALDMDAVLPPGHVSPYVIPAALALSEQRQGSGADLVAALAIGHEMTFRIAKSMDYLRDVKNGKSEPPKVFGYSSSLFGAASAVMRVANMSADRTAHGLGLAAYCMPVAPQMAWVMHAPASTVKYGPTGPLVQQALNAWMYAQGGHRGDLMVLDDAEFGFPAMIGTKRWEPDAILDQLGTEWRFPTASSLKPYPYCRVLHTAFDVMGRLQKENGITADEIESIKVQGEAFVDKPIWQNEDIAWPVDAQFSLTHGIALAAHQVKPGKAWQTEKLIRSDSVLDLMKRVKHEPHPNYAAEITKNPAARATHVEIKARGQIFAGDGLFPKGSPSPDPESRMTTEEVIAKFKNNGSEVLTESALDDAIDAILNLEKHPDMARVAAIFVDGALSPASA